MSEKINDGGMMDIARKVADAIELVLGCNPSDIVPSATMESLGADSLDGIEFLIVLEDKFTVEITDKQADKWKTVADVENGISAILAAGSPTGKGE